MEQPRFARAFLLPAMAFLALAGLSLLVWRQQTAWDRELVARRTGDVCLQAALRLETFVDSHLRVAHIFAARWTTHETRDFSHDRFRDFAGILLRQLPGFRAISIVPPGSGEGWSMPDDSGLEQRIVAADFAVPEADAGSDVFVSGTYGPDGRLFQAVIPLRRGGEDLGRLAVEFDTQTLIDDCFHERIRSRFLFRLEDEGAVFFRSSSEATDAAFSGAKVRAEESLSIGGRTWRLAMAPRPETVERGSWVTRYSVPLLGFGLSVGLGALGFLLVRRMDLYKTARDQAVHEVRQRQQAETALAQSQARYRDVFRSTTDGLLVVASEGEVLEANDAAAKLAGWGPGELVGRRLADLLRADHRPEEVEFRRRLDEDAVARMDTVMLGAGGETHDVELRGTRMRSEGTSDLLVIVTDVSVRKRVIARLELLSRKALAAQEEERARLSRELHDELGQLLTALRLEMGWLEKRLGPNGKGEIFRNTVLLVEEATQELRRICRGLRPPLLDDLGLVPAARLLVEEFEARAGLAVGLEIGLEDKRGVVSREVSLCVYRVLQESLTNVHRHARARTVRVVLAAPEDEVTLEVTDDGVGFDPARPGALQGCGLDGMRERVGLVNGSLIVTSSPGCGTRIVARFPGIAAPGEEEA